MAAGHKKKLCGHPDHNKAKIPTKLKQSRAQGDHPHHQDYLSKGRGREQTWQLARSPAGTSVSGEGVGRSELGQRWGCGWRGTGWPGPVS